MSGLRPCSKSVTPESSRLVFQYLAIAVLRSGNGPVPVFELFDLRDDRLEVVNSSSDRVKLTFSNFEPSERSASLNVSELLVEE